MTEQTLLDRMLEEIGDQPHGLDFGGWTVWDPEKVLEKYKKLIDFVIWGIGWGALPHSHYEVMIPIIKKIPRRMIYHFFNRAPAWEDQADFILRTVDLVDPKAIFLDWERSPYGVDEHNRLGNQASHAWQIIQKVKANYDGPVGLYCGFYMYMLFEEFFPVGDLPWWCAHPDNIPFSTPGNAVTWSWIKRPLGDYIFDQYSWEGVAEDWGATNNKKEMDLDIFPGPMAQLDEFLGIKDGPPSQRRAMPPYRIKPR